MVLENHPRLSITQQCHLLDISRSSWYKPQNSESCYTLELMRVMDELFLNEPYLGSRQMRKRLLRLGYKAGRHRVRRLMRLMGLAAVYQKPRTSSTRCIRICCAVSPSRGPIRYGAPT